MKNRTVAVVLICLAPTLACAEIYKLAVPEDAGMHLYWWPVLKGPAGWVHDEGASQYSGVNVLVPKGQTYKDAPAVMYGRADYKPRLPGVHSLGEYIEKDRAELAAESATTVIANLPSASTSDGKALTVISYVIPTRKQWEVVAYGEEGEFYLLFTLSASSEKGFRDAEPAFHELIAACREKP